MRHPLLPGCRIDATRMRTWLDSFEGYRVAVSQGAIERWIEQFDPGHRDMAARILDSVDFINKLRIQAAFRTILQSLPGWSIQENQRLGKWRFVPFSGSSGTSADSMIHLFRMANALTSRQFNKLFIYRRDLLQEDYTENDTIVFIDDFSGTGTQACNSWREFFSEIVPLRPKKVLALVAISIRAQQRITRETELEVWNDIQLRDSDNIFHDECLHFTALDKQITLRYCRRADRSNPRGFGDCGYVVVFPERCPNNSIPVLYMSHQRWRGLFPRHD